MVTDRKTKQPIPFATIRSIGKLNGTYTDSLGRFLIRSELTDSLFISSIGYRSIRISQKSILNSLIFLDPEIVELDTVIVKNRKKIGEQILGIANVNQSTIWGSGGYGDEFVQKITLPDSNNVYRIKKIKIGASRYIATIPMIIHIYTVAENGKPGINILIEKIILRQEDFNKKLKRFIVDVSNYNIFLHEPAVYIGVEWMPVPTKGQAIGCTAITLTADIPESLTFSKAILFNDNVWFRPLVIDKRQTNPNNTIISIQVDELK